MLLSLQYFHGCQNWITPLIQEALLPKRAKAFTFLLPLKSNHIKYGIKQNLVQPIDDRWNSYFEMIACLVINTQAPNETLQQETSFNPYPLIKHKRAKKLVDQCWPIEHLFANLIKHNKRTS